MIKGIAEKLLSNYFGEYVEGLEVESIRLGLSSGNLNLQNLKLRVGALDEFKLPINVKLGYIKNLNVNIPLNLWSNPVSIVIDGLYLIAIPQNTEEFDEKSSERLSISIKRKQLLHADAIQKASFAYQDNKNTGMLWHLLTQVTSNLNICIKNVHIRYEDFSSIPNRSFSIGITISSLNLTTVDAQGEECFDSSESHIYHKIVKLDNFSLYWESNSVILMQKYQNEEDILSYLKSSICNNSSHHSDLCYILYPFKANLKLTINNSLNMDSPKYSFSYISQNFKVKLLHNQFKDATGLLDSWIALRLKRHISSVFLYYQPYKPTCSVIENPKIWWKYAFRVIVSMVCPKKKLPLNPGVLARASILRKIYIPIHKREQNVEWHTALNEEEKKLHDSIEEELPLDSILIFRSMAFSELTLERSQYQEKKANAKQRGFWQSWFYGSSEEELNILLKPSERSQLYHSLDYHQELAKLQYPPNYVKLHADLTIEDLDIILSRDQTDIVQTKLDVHCSFLQMSSSWITQIAVQSIDVINPSSKNCFSSVLHPSVTTSPILSLFLESSPLDIDADYRIKMQLVPIHMVIDYKFFQRLYSFFSTINSNQNVIQAMLDWKDQKRSQLIKSLTLHQKYLISIEIENPSYLFPLDCDKEDSEIIVLAIEKISLNSKLSPSSDDIVNCVVHPLQLENYDLFCYNIHHASISICNSFQDWNKNISSYPIINHFDIQIWVFTCILRDYEKIGITPIYISSNMSSLHIFFHKRLFSLIQLFIQFSSSNVIEFSPSSSNQSTNNEIIPIQPKQLNLSEESIVPSLDLQCGFFINSFKCTLFKDNIQNPFIDFSISYLKGIVISKEEKVNVNFSLKKILFEDMNQELTSKFRFLISSEIKDSDLSDQDFIQIQLISILPDSLHYNGIQHDLNLKYNELIINWNPDTFRSLFVNLYDFFDSIKSYTQSMNQQNIEIKKIMKNLSSSEENDQSIFIQITAELKLLKINLNKELSDRQISQLIIQKLQLEHIVNFSGIFESHGTLQDLMVSDLRYGKTPIRYPNILKMIPLMENGVDQGIVIRYKFSKIIESTSSLSLNIGSLNFSYDHSFVMEIQDYFSEGVIGAILFSKTIVSASKRVIESQQSSSFFYFSFQLDNPIIWIPQSNFLNSSNDFFRVDLGCIQIYNTLESESSGEKIICQLSNTNISSSFRITSKIPLLQYLDIHMSIIRPLEKQKADIIISSEVSSFSLQFLLSEYNLLFKVLDNNILFKRNFKPINPLPINDQDILTHTLYKYDMDDSPPLQIKATFSCPQIQLQLYNYSQKVVDESFPFINIKAISYNINFQRLDDHFDIFFSLKDFFIEDLLQKEKSPFRFLLSSTSLYNINNIKSSIHQDLIYIHCVYYPQSPISSNNSKNSQPLISLKIKFYEIYCNWNPDSMVYLFLFFSKQRPIPTDAFPQISEISSEIKDDLMIKSNTSQSTDSDSKVILIQINFNLEKILISFNKEKEERHFFIFQAKSLSVEYQKYPLSSICKGTLGDYIVSLDSFLTKHTSLISFIHPQSSIIKFEYHMFDTPKDSYIDSFLSLDLSSFRIIYLQKIIFEMIDYFFAGIIGVFSFQTSSDSVKPIIKPIEKTRFNQIEINVLNPILFFPRHEFSDEHFEFNLTTIHISNSFQNENQHSFDCISCKINQIEMFFDKTSAEKVIVGSNLLVDIRRPLEENYDYHPRYQINSSIALIEVNFWQSEMILLLQILYENFFSSPNISNPRLLLDKFQNIVYKYGDPQIPPSSLCFNIKSDKVTFHAKAFDDGHFALFELTSLFYQINRDQQQTMTNSVKINKISLNDERSSSSLSLYRTAISAIESHDISSEKDLLTLNEPALEKKQLPFLDIQAPFLELDYITTPNSKSFNIRINRPNGIFLPEFFGALTSFFSFIFIITPNSNNTSKNDSSPVAPSSLKTDLNIILSGCRFLIIQDLNISHSKALTINFNTKIFNCSSKLQIEVEDLHSYVCSADIPTQLLAHSIISPLSFNFQQTLDLSSIHRKLNFQPLEFRFSYQDFLLMYDVGSTIYDSIQKGRDLIPPIYPQISSNLDLNPEDIELKQTDSDITYLIEMNEIVLNSFIILLLNDCAGHYYPLIRFHVSNGFFFLKTNQNEDNTCRFNLESNILFNSLYYNPVVVTWEPLIEPISLLVHGYLGKPLKKTKKKAIPLLSFESSSDFPNLNIVISFSFLNTFYTTLSTWKTDYNQITRRESAFSPYYIKNQTGVDIKYWINNEEKSVFCINDKKEERIPLFFSDKYLKELFINIQLEGGWNVLENILVSLVGKNVYQISCQQKHTFLAVDINLEKGSKIILLHSIYRVENHTSVPLEFECRSSKDDIFQFGPILPFNNIHLPISIVHSNNSHNIFIRPSPEFGYHWSSASLSFTIPQSTTLICHYLEDPKSTPFFCYVEYEKISSLINLLISSPLTIYNHFPYSLSYQFVIENSVVARGKIAKGTSEKISVNLSSHPVFSFQIAGFKWSPWIEINRKRHEDYFIVYDPFDSPLFCDIHYSKFEIGCIEMEIYCQFWLINFTGINISFGYGRDIENIKATASQMIPTIEELYETGTHSILSGWTTNSKYDIQTLQNSKFIPKNWVWADEWHIDMNNRKVDDKGWEYRGMGDWHQNWETFDSTRRRRWIRTRIPIESDTSPNVSLFGPKTKNDLLFFRIATGTWSRGIDPQQKTDGNFSLFCSDLPGSSQTIHRYDLVVNFSQAPSPYKYTTVIKITLCYIIKNHCPNPLTIQQNESKQECIIQPNESLGYIWENKDLPSLIRVGYQNMWSGPFSITSPNEFSFCLRKPNSNIPPTILLTNVRLFHESIIVSFFSENKEIPRYRIKNYSGETIYFKQFGIDTSFSLLHDNQCSIFAWDNIQVKQPLRVLIRIRSSDIIIPFDAIGYKSDDLIIGNRLPDRMIYSKVITEESTKVLLITCRSDFNEEEQNEISFQLQILFPSVSISLINQTPCELIFLQMNNFSLIWGTSFQYHKFFITLKSMQIDNTLKHSQLPVLFTSIDIPNQDFLATTLVFSNKNSSIFFFQYFAFLMKQYKLSIEERWLKEFINFVIQLNSLNQEEKVIDPSKSFESLLHNQDSYNESSILNQLLFFNHFEFHPGTSTVTYLSSPQETDTTFLLSSFGMMLKNFENATISLGSMKAKHFGVISFSNLVERLKSHYYHQLLKQFYIILGSNRLTGLGCLVNHIGDGLNDFFVEPASAIIEGPQAFGHAIAKGSSSLFVHSITGVSDTANRIISTVGTGLASLSADDDYIERRNRQNIQDHPENPISGIFSGIIHIGKGVYEGVSGIVANPYKGAEKEGFSGFAKGIGQGMLGLVVKPVTGVFDGASKITESISNTFENPLLYQGRCRLPRMFYGTENTFRIYNEMDALINDIMIKLEFDHEKYLNQYIVSRGLIIITNKTIHKVKKSNDTYYEKWIIEWSSVKLIEIDVDNSAVILHSLNVSKTLQFNSPQLAQNCYDSMEKYLKASQT